VDDHGGAYVERGDTDDLRPADSRGAPRDHLDAVAKLVGVSDDFERLAACESVARLALEDRISIALEMRRSRQPSETPTKPAERARNGAELEIGGLARPSAERPPHYGHGCKPPQSVFFQEVDSGLTPARLGRRPAAARPPWNRRSDDVRRAVAPAAITCQGRSA
jgi:hypothetical protein